MPDIFPTKELLQMIEERIPYGRFLTTTALLLAVLAVIVGSCSFLYRAIIVPIANLVMVGVSTGKINRNVFGRVASSIVGTVVVLLIFEWMVRGSSRLMREVLDNSKSVLERNDEVLALSKGTTEQMMVVAHAVKDLDARVSTLEGRHQ